MYFRFIAILCTSSLICHGQKGDRGKVQHDPIPAAKIPAAPHLSQADAIKSFQLAKGFSIEPLIDDAEVHMPVALSFDADGRAWVVEMSQYMVDLDGTQENLPTGKIKVFEDTTGDGKLDKVTLFLDGLVMPRAVAVTTDGVLFASSGKLQFIQRDGVKPKGIPEIIDARYAVGGNAEHQANGLLLARDNWYYSAKSNKRYRRIKGKWIMQETAFRGQWGIAQDDYGRLVHNTNSRLLTGDVYRPNLFRNLEGYTTSNKISQRLASNRVFPVRMNPGLNRAYQKKTLDDQGRLVNATAAAGMTIYRGDNFPESFYGSAFISEPGANLIKLIDIERTSEHKLNGMFRYPDEEFIASTDEWFRPVNIYTAPDGCLWVIDLYFGLLQHKAYMTTYLRKQYASRNLDKPMSNNGRIYRIRYDKSPLKKPAKLSGLGVSELTTYLTHKNGTVRDTAQRLLVDCVKDPIKLVAFKDAMDSFKSSGLARNHALWIYESTGSIPAQFVKACLKMNDLELQASALELAHLADQPIDSDLLAYRAKPNTAVAAVFALGQMATEEAYDRAQMWLAEFSKSVDLMAEAYVSGLGGNLPVSENWSKSRDKELSKQLTLATKFLAKSGHIKAPEVPQSEKLRYERGKKLYLGSAACMACHGAKGEGQANMFPPLAPSNWVNGDPVLLAKVILHGLEGPIKVNGVAYNSPQAMPKFVQRTDLTDEDLACLMTYLRHMKGNKGGAVSARLVKKVRDQTRDRSANYTQAELMN